MCSRDARFFAGRDSPPVKSEILTIPGSGWAFRYATTEKTDRKETGDRKKATGTGTCAEEILGLIVLTDNHNDSNSLLGNPDTITTYAGSRAHLELDGKSDNLSWYEETLNLYLRTGYGIDQVRVITEHSVAPTFDRFFLNDINSNLTISEGDSLSASLYATDPNRDAISFFLNDNLIGTDYDESGTRYTRTDLGVFEDETTVTYQARVTDEDGKDSNTITRTVTVNNVAPTITSLTENLSLLAGNTFDFSATATDPGILDILTYEWDFDDDGLFDNFIGNTGKFLFSDPGEYEIGLRVSDGDGGLAYDSFTVTTEEPNLPEPYSFRFTDIKAVEGDPESDKFQFEFEIANWTDTPAAGIYIALNEATNLLPPIGEYPGFSGATIDSNGRPLGADSNPLPGNQNIPNLGNIFSSSDTAIQWNTGNPILNRDLLGVTSNEQGCGLVPGCDFSSGNPVIADIETIDNGENILDGFVFTVDNIDESELISFNWFLLDENGDPIGTASSGNEYGHGVVSLIRKPLDEQTDPEAIFYNTDTTQTLISTPNEPPELFYNNVNRVSDFVSQSSPFSLRGFTATLAGLDAATSNNSEIPEEDLITLFNGNSIRGLTLDFLNPEDNKFNAPINGILIENPRDPKSVPEPSTLGMIGLAVLSLWRCKRKR